MNTTSSQAGLASFERSAVSAPLSVPPHYALALADPLRPLDKDAVIVPRWS